MTARLQITGPFSESSVQVWLALFRTHRINIRRLYLLPCEQPQPDKTPGAFHRLEIYYDTTSPLLGDFLSQLKAELNHAASAAVLWQN